MECESCQPLFAALRRLEPERSKAEWSEALEVLLLQVLQELSDRVEQWSAGRQTLPYRLPTRFDVQK